MTDDNRDGRRRFPETRYTDIDGEPMETRDRPAEFAHEIAGGPDFARVSVRLEAGQTIKAERSAMISMDSNVRMKSRFRGGFRRILGGESIIANEFTAERSPGQVEFSGELPGDIYHYNLGSDGNEALFLQSGGFLASGMNVRFDTKFQGFIKGFFSGAGLFLIKCSGVGDVFFSAYGGIVEIEVEDEYVIDNNHIVAFTEGLDYTVTRMGGYKSFFLSGEGLVTHFRGQGKIWIQTRKFPAFAAWIYPFRPVQRRREQERN